ncbi:MAG: hypothetical protein ACOYLU_09060, partial [Limisphaerales bacterium]
MKMVRQRFVAILGAWIICCSLEVPVARAIIVFGSGDPARNTEPPSGSLEASGWRWQGRWK